MSMSKDSYTYNRKTFEDAEFPILCETCLGNNPYVRMIKTTYGNECNVCNRPFTGFRWMPGKGARYKKTEICQTCAKLKNVCQTCLLDLEYGLPVQVRDHALAIDDDLPRYGANRDFFIQNADRALAQTDGTVPGGKLATITDAGNNSLLRKLARTQPYYNRNRPHICSFFVKGECNRGEECPYRHEKPTDPDDPLSQQNMRDRYYGSNDPVADKLLNRAKAMPKLTPPEDKSITTLFVGNLGRDEKLYVHESDLRDYFYQFGEIRQIHMLPEKCNAFIQFTSRESAELAADRTFEQLFLNGLKIRVRWGHSRAQSNQSKLLLNETLLESVPNLPSDSCPVPSLDVGAENLKASTLKHMRVEDLPLPPEPPTKLFVPNVVYSAAKLTDQAEPSASSSTKIYYPSQDPQRLGAKGDVAE